LASYARDSPGAAQTSRKSLSFTSWLSLHLSRSLHASYDKKATYCEAPVAHALTCAFISHRRKLLETNVAHALLRAVSRLISTLPAQAKVSHAKEVPEGAASASVVSRATVHPAMIAIRSPASEWRFGHSPLCNTLEKRRDELTLHTPRGPLLPAPA
jgi:hypothetical protein